MNNVSLVGRLTRDPEVRYTDGGLSIARFSMAVDRKFKKDGQPDADFPNCVAFGKTAEFIEKYFTKGQRMGATGRIQTGLYTNNEGVKVYTTDVVVENVEFVESKNASQGAQSNIPEPSLSEVNNGFVPAGDIGDEELPFN